MVYRIIHWKFELELFRIVEMEVELQYFFIFV